MVRVYVICEGATEVQFVKTVLAEHFAAQSIYMEAAIIGRPGHKGGNVKLDRLTGDIRNLLNDKDAYCTMIVDYYGSGYDFPGREAAEKAKAPADKLRHLQAGLTQVVTEKLGSAARRFIPYVQMYEFEALLFSDTAVFAKTANQPALEQKLSKIVDTFDTPEHINSTRDTCPSQRIIKHWATYDKKNDGLNIAKALGLAVIRRECPLFDGWIVQLEALAAA